MKIAVQTGSGETVVASPESWVYAIIAVLSDDVRAKVMAVARDVEAQRGRVVPAVGVPAALAKAGFKV